MTALSTLNGSSIVVRWSPALSMQCGVDSIAGEPAISIDLAFRDGSSAGRRRSQLPEAYSYPKGAPRNAVMAQEKHLPMAQEST